MTQPDSLRLELPTHITHHQLMAACHILGFDPNVTYRFTIDAEVHKVTVYGYIRGKRGLQRRRHRNHVRTIKAVIPVGYTPPPPEPIFDETAAFLQDAARWTPELTGWQKTIVAEAIADRDDR